MSSITVSDLKNILKDVPDDYEVVMNLHHRYDISKEDGKKGWIAFINSVDYDKKHKEIRLMN